MTWSLAWVSQRLAVAADLSDEVAVKLMSQLQVIWDNIGDLSDAATSTSGCVYDAALAPTTR